MLLASQFLGGPLAAYAVGVVGIEVGAMFAGVGNMVGQTRQPLQRVHGLEITAEESARLRATVDPHSPGRYRVNGVVSNMPEFQQAFGCKAGDAMVRENACRVW